MTTDVNQLTYAEKIKRLRKKNGFPTGVSECDYVDYDNWTNKQRAWEFLRRKKPYQFFCNRHKENSKAKLDSTFRDLFGLEKYIHYGEVFDNQKIKFITEHVTVYSENGNIKETPRAKLNLILMPGDLYIKFNLATAAQSNKNLTQLLKTARDILASEAKCFSANNGTISRKNRQKQVNYLDLIRLIDLNNSNSSLKKNIRLSQAEIFKTIFLDQSGAHLGGTIRSNPELQKMFQKKWELAQHYMKKDKYLDLAATKDSKSKMTGSCT